MPDKRNRGSSWHLPWRTKEKHYHENYHTEDRYNRPPVHRRQSRKWSFTELRGEDQEPSYTRHGRRPDPIYPGYLGTENNMESENQRYELKQKLRIWADWRTGVNDYRLRRERGRDSGFFFHTPAPPPLSSLRNMGDPLPLMSFSIGEDSATCMRPKEFLRMGIPRVQKPQQATLEEATRDLHRDIHDMHFREQRVWRSRPVINQGFATR